MDIESAYSVRYSNALVPLAKRLEVLLAEYFAGVPRIDRISARAKSIDRFVAKALKSEDGKLKYTDPLNQIQDQIGARIITFYSDDVPQVAETVIRYFRAIEDRTIVPDSDSEFGYFGKHFILLLPRDLIDPNAPPIKPFFELQIKTLFQHAWSEANHDLCYKPQGYLTANFRRCIAFTAAQAWGADQMFNELQRKVGQQSHVQTTSEIMPNTDFQVSDANR